MTEAEWLATEDVTDLTHHKKCRNERKRRLLSCACCRRVLPMLPDKRFVEVVSECERYADGEIRWPAMLAVRKKCRAAYDELEAAEAKEFQLEAANAVRAATDKEFMHFKMAIEYAAYAFASKSRPKWDRGHKKEEAIQVALARDVFGNPYRPVTFERSWRTSTSVALAKQMYDSRDFSAMPILADALQDAGCENADILGHCRGPGPHVRGCWVADLVLCRA